MQKSASERERDLDGGRAGVGKVRERLTRAVDGVTTHERAISRHQVEDGGHTLSAVDVIKPLDNIISSSYPCGVDKEVLRMFLVLIDLSRVWPHNFSAMGII